MSNANAMTERFEEIEIFGQPVLFTSGRIDRATVPSNLILYEIRHSDDDFFTPAEIGKGVWVNHFGTVITKNPIELESYGFREIEEEDFKWLDSGCNTVEAYIKTYCSDKPKEVSKPSIQDRLNEKVKEVKPPTHEKGSKDKEAR